MDGSNRREHLVDTAISLFLERGFHATGIDTIVEVSGVSKKTLYRHFRSKEELILAALKKYDGLFRNNFMRNVEERAAGPAERILAVFDVADEWFAQNNFFGCMFINAIGEYAELDTPIRQACKDFKLAMQKYFLKLCLEAELPNPETLADQLAMVFEGAIVTAQVSGSRGRAAKTAMAAAVALIDQAKI